MNEKPKNSSETNKENNTLDEYEKWEKYNLGGSRYAAYEARLKQKLDEESAKREAELRVQDAKKRGYEEGRRIVKETEAKNLLKRNWEIDEIVKITQLSEERILELRQEIEK